MLKFPLGILRVLAKELVGPVAQPEASAASRESPRLASVPYWQLGVLAALTLWVYWSTLTHLVGQWWTDPNFSHGFFVPLFSAFVIWQERDRLARLTPQPAWSGLAVIALGLVELMVGQMGAELFLARSSLLLLLAGIVILFFGWNTLRALFFPWAFLLLMIPIPSIIFNQITFPLQLLASRVSASVLPLFGVPCFRDGNVINLSSMALEVAEACWVRWALALASVPIAVIANSVRIIGTGLLVQYWDAEKAEGYFHASWGWIIFVISLLMLYATHFLIRLLWPDKTMPGAGKPEKIRS